jgi:hypothetical protein
MKLFKKKAKVIPKLSDEEKAFLVAWAGLYNTPLSCKVCRGSDGYIRLGNGSWFWLARKYRSLKVGEEYTIEELTK